MTYSKKQLGLVSRMYKSGMTRSDISAFSGIPVGSLGKILVQLGIWRPKFRRFRMTRKVLQRMIGLYLKGNSLERVARILGCSDYLVAASLKASNISRRPAMHKRKGWKHPRKVRRLIAETSSLRRHSVESRRKMSEIAKARGSRHNFYVDGKGRSRDRERSWIMKGLEYRLWRESVFQRDDFTCQECGQRGGILCADHIKSWRDYPGLRFVLSNGRTLCKQCHLATANFGGRLHSHKRCER